ncbi:MAG: SusE domain-containing protein [Bacteroidales bacterium]|jgi:hypothetical protein|nr:SusE domain-containing protein [Bacteroidales bacterium]
MKAVLIKTAVIALFAVILSACSSDGEVRDTGVTAVKSLYEPDHEKAVVLQASASATLYFEWEPARAEDSGNALYEVAFDKANGDFSAPLMMVAAHNNGGDNYVEISHKQLNSIAAKAGVESSAQGTLKWTVYSSKGANAVKAEEERSLTLTRLAGFAELPDQLYLTGEATEAGADLADALVMKKLGEGEFEIYTRLTEGKTFKFVSAATGTPKEYSLSGEELVEGGTSTVSKTGIYKYYVDFNIGSFSTKEVTKVNLFLCWSQLKIELPYKGLGVWEIINRTIAAEEISDGGANGDDRYKFRMESSDGETEWRTVVSTDVKPTGNDAYYYMEEKPDTNDQWTNNQIWKSPVSGWSGKTYDITFSLSPKSPYTHHLIIK